MNNENKKIIGYDSQTGQPIYESQNNIINNQQMINQQFGTLNPNNNQSNYQQQIYQNINNQQVKKKKLKWWIPVLFFVGGILMSVGSTIAEILIRANGEMLLDYEITKTPAIMIFRWLALLSWLLVIPSLIIVIVKYNKRKTK